jgi:hypothetical protein
MAVPGVRAARRRATIVSTLVVAMLATTGVAMAIGGFPPPPPDPGLPPTPVEQRVIDALNAIGAFTETRGPELAALEQAYRDARDRLAEARRSGDRTAIDTAEAEERAAADAARSVREERNRLYAELSSALRDAAEAELAEVAARTQAVLDRMNAALVRYEALVAAGVEGLDHERDVIETVAEQLEQLVTDPPADPAAAKARLDELERHGGAAARTVDDTLRTTWNTAYQWLITRLIEMKTSDPELKAEVDRLDAGAEALSGVTDPSERAKRLPELIDYLDRSQEIIDVIFETGLRDSLEHYQQLARWAVEIAELFDDGAETPIYPDTVVPSLREALERIDAALGDPGAFDDPDMKPELRRLLQKTNTSIESDARIVQGAVQDEWSEGLGTINQIRGRLNRELDPSDPRRRDGTVQLDKLLKELGDVPLIQRGRRMTNLRDAVKEAERLRKLVDDEPVNVVTDWQERVRDARQTLEAIIAGDDPEAAERARQLLDMVKLFEGNDPPAHRGTLNDQVFSVLEREISTLGNDNPGGGGNPGEEPGDNDTDEHPDPPPPEDPPEDPKKTGDNNLLPETPEEEVVPEPVEKQVEGAAQRPDELQAEAPPAATPPADTTPPPLVPGGTPVPGNGGGGGGKLPLQVCDDGRQDKTGCAPTPIDPGVLRPGLEGEHTDPDVKSQDKTGATPIDELKLPNPVPPADPDVKTPGPAAPPIDDGVPGGGCIDQTIEGGIPCPTAMEGTKHEGPDIPRPDRLVNQPVGPAPEPVLPNVDPSPPTTGLDLGGVTGTIPGPPETKLPTVPLPGPGPITLLPEAQVRPGAELKELLGGGLGEPSAPPVSVADMLKAASDPAPEPEPAVVEPEAGVGPPPDCGDGGAC